MVSGFGAGVAGDKARVGKVSYNRLGAEFLHERATDGEGRLYRRVWKRGERDARVPGSRNLVGVYDQVECRR